MPSKESVALRERMMLLKPLTSKMTIKTARAGQDAYGELGARANASKVEYSEVKFGSFKACFATCKEGCEENRAILYLHGGGYTAGNIKYSCGFGSILAANIPRKVLCVAYRLAPEYPFPAALEDSLAAYRYLLDEGFEPDKISFVGESAGGGLIYALGLELRRLEMPLPSCFVAISPWSDLTFSGRSYITNKDTDPSLCEPLLREYAKMYAGDDVSNPLVSPVFGDFTGFPPSLILCGGDELLTDDSVMLARRLSHCGCEAGLNICEGMWHVYPLFPSPEASSAMNLIKNFLERNR